MKVLLYKVCFKATKTCDNGNEMRVTKIVYMPRFDENTRKHITPDQQIERGTAVLKAEHFYEIEYKETKAIEMLLG